MKKKFEVGNVIKDTHGDVLIITKFSTYENRDGTTYDYVEWDCYGFKNASGGFKVQGSYDTQTCSCWYDYAFRCYKSEFPDQDCEWCKGTGEEYIYRQGLNDCKLLAINVTEYKKKKIKQNIKKLKQKLKVIENLNASLV